jgi:arylsulfatase A-like enzyme
MKPQILFIVTFFATAPCEFLEASDQPNVVILFTDDQGTLDANCYGAKDLHTPNIDRLAREGLRFTQAYAHTVCCPSRAAIMTGRHPQRSRVNSWTQGNMNGPDGINMSLEEITIAETLKAAGYHTALFGKWHLGSHRDFGPMKQGFDEFFGLRDGFIDNFNHYFLHGKGYHDLYEGTKEVWAKDKFFPDMVVDRSTDFIKRHKDDRFFLYVGLNIPHYPEQPPQEHLDRYKDLKQPRRSYAAFVTTTDFYIGKVLDELDKHGIAEKTIVIFMSDNGHSKETNHIRVENHTSGLPKGHKYGANGGGGFTGKWTGHKGTFFEGGVRVPAIIRYPASIPNGLVRDQAVTAMDWLPTVVDYCDIKPPASQLDGKSLRDIISSKDAPTHNKVLYFQWQNRWAVRKGDWKLLRTQRRDKSDNLQLFSLAGENPETVDLAKKNPKVVAELHELYRKWAADVFSKN